MKTTNTNSKLSCNGDASSERHTAASRLLDPGRMLMSLLSPRGPGSRLSIVIYHRVLPSRDPLFPSELDAHDFDAQMGFLKQCFNVIPLTDAMHGLQHGTLPARAACVTFDDGYADNAEVALPILQKHDIPATFFIATGFLNGGRMWNDTVIELVRGVTGSKLDLGAIKLGSFDIATTRQRQETISALLSMLKYLPFETRKKQIEEMCGLAGVSLPDNLMMNSMQVRQLHGAGMEIGGHTVNHPILARLEKKAARQEIAEGKEVLQSLIGAPVRLFAYPNGKPNQDYLADHVNMVKDLGFDGAVSTAWGAAKAGDNLYQLPRFTPWDRQRMRFTARMARNLFRKAETV
jgi:peptidoglycan/xylan/chitin deacetylase (PgdA/CDA1 family)